MPVYLVACRLSADDSFFFYRPIFFLSKRIITVNLINSFILRVINHSECAHKMWTTRSRAPLDLGAGRKKNPMKCFRRPQTCCMSRSIDTMERNDFLSLARSQPILVDLIADREEKEKKYMGSTSSIRLRNAKCISLCFVLLLLYFFLCCCVGFHPFSKPNCVVSTSAPFYPVVHEEKKTKFFFSLASRILLIFQFSSFLSSTCTKAPRRK